jgi:hypothetical protein
LLSINLKTRKEEGGKKKKGLKIKFYLLFVFGKIRCRTTLCCGYVVGLIFLCKK